MPECRLSVRVTPKAARDRILGFDGDTVRIAVTAPPVEGRANDAVVKFLAKTLDLPASRFCVVRGHTQRNKVIAVDGLSGEEARSRLEAAAQVAK